MHLVAQKLPTTELLSSLYVTQRELAPPTTLLQSLSAPHGSQRRGNAGTHKLSKSPPVPATCVHLNPLSQLFVHSFAHSCPLEPSMQKPLLQSEFVTHGHPPSAHPASETVVPSPPPSANVSVGAPTSVCPEVSDGSTSRTVSLGELSVITLESLGSVSATSAPPASPPPPAVPHPHARTVGKSSRIRYLRKCDIWAPRGLSSTDCTRLESALYIKPLTPLF